MQDVPSKSDLLQNLKSRAAALGLSVGGDAHALTGEIESIGAKWLLGGRKVVYRMSCRLDEAQRAVRFRESVNEKTWGMPPPTLSVEKTSVKGWERSGARTDKSVGGGGTVDYGRVREELKRAVTDAGWRFELEGGRAP
jgi:hypothetical protein